MIRALAAYARQRADALTLALDMREISLNRFALIALLPGRRSKTQTRAQFVELVVRQHSRDFHLLREDCATPSERADWDYLRSPIKTVNTDPATGDIDYRLSNELITSSGS